MRGTLRHDYPVRVTGRNYQWHIQYAGPDQQLDTNDDEFTERHLRLPAEVNVKLELCSDDFVYSFFLPHVDLLEMAVPNSPYEVEFVTDTEGVYELLGSQMCGYTHPQLLGRVYVDSP